MNFASTLFNPFVAAHMNLRPERRAGHQAVMGEAMDGYGPLVAIACGASALVALSLALHCVMQETRLAQRWDIDWVERARVVRLLGFRLRLALALLLLSLPTFIFAVMGPL
ncbi:MAG: hypothetical protein JO055_13460 [Alphaproteobacteria bacterium]|nr:hypothetical protein [Alphaproteobacteria bacterium]